MQAYGRHFWHLKSIGSHWVRVEEDREDSLPVVMLQNTHAERARRHAHVPRGKEGGVEMREVKRRKKKWTGSEAVSCTVCMLMFCSSWAGAG